MELKLLEAEVDMAASKVRYAKFVILNCSHMHAHTHAHARTHTQEEEEEKKQGHAMELRAEVASLQKENKKLQEENTYLKGQTRE